jgi:hypothetical protein
MKKMKLLKLLHDSSMLRFLLTSLVALAVILFSGFAIRSIASLESSVLTKYDLLQDDQAELESQYLEAENRVKLAQEENAALQSLRETLEAEIAKASSDENYAKLVRLQTIFETYQKVVTKIDRNANLQIPEPDSVKNRASWGEKLLTQKLDEIEADLKAADTDIETAYNQYLASLPTSTPRPTSAPTTKPAPPAPPAAGYSYQTVSTSRGNFGVYLIKMSRSEVRLRTLTANSDNCSNDCPAKSLASYVSENGGYAGINGTYFCPPDYSWCSGKTNTYDSAVYNSNLNKWLNEHILAWNNLALVTANGNSLAFHKYSKDFGKGSVSAGISSFPGLVENNNIIVNDYSMDAKQLTAKGPRGAVGFDDSNVYLAIVTGATVPDAAYAMQALGAKYAMNLDGGGSSALYISGSYKVGPGRSLPNAIILVK